MNISYTADRLIIKQNRVSLNYRGAYAYTCTQIQVTGILCGRILWTPTTLKYILKNKSSIQTSQLNNEYPTKTLLKYELLLVITRVYALHVSVILNLCHLIM